MSPVTVDPADNQTPIRIRTENVYNSDGQLICIKENLKQYSPTNIVDTDPSYTETFYEYDDFGRLIAVIMPATTVTVHDQYNDLTEVSAHPRYEYDYDAMGNQTAQRTHRYQLVSDGYDSDGKPNGTVYNSFDVDDDDDVDSDDIIETTFTYDELGRQLSRTLPMGETETFTYYQNTGQLFTETSFEGYTTAYFYDGFTNVMHPMNATGGQNMTLKMFYSVFNPDLSSYTVAATYHDYLYYDYDLLGRVTQVGNNTYTYNDQGQVIEIENELVESGLDEFYTYIHYEYDPMTNQQIATWTSDTNNSGPITSTEYEYDLLDRLKTVTQTSRDSQTISEETIYTYDLLGRLVRTDLPNGVSIVNTYDNLDRLIKVAHYEDGVDATYDDFSDNDAYRVYTYEYRLDGRKSEVLEQEIISSTTNNLGTTSWQYDALGRVVRETYDDSSYDYTTDYTYDLTGNRFSKATDQGSDSSYEETITYTYDANDRLLTETGTLFNSVATTIWYYYGGTVGNTSQASDHYGSTIKTTYQTGKYQYETATPANVIDTTTYTYNYDGRINGIDSNRKELDSTGTQTVDITAYYSYAYDHQGFRISNDYHVTIDSQTTSKYTVYLIDKQNPTGYAQVLEEWVRPNPVSSPTSLKTYTLGLDVISQATDTSPGNSTGETVVFLMVDGHGSTRYLTTGLQYGTQDPMDGAGDMVANELYNYDAYGVSLATVGLLPENQTATNLLYAGEMFDRNLQMYSLRARYYNPNIGRFNRLDPFIGVNSNPLTLHKYGYCHGDPVNGIDPSGLFSYTELLTGLWISLKFVAIPLAAGLAGHHGAAGFSNGGSNRTVYTVPVDVYIIRPRNVYGTPVHTVENARLSMNRANKFWTEQAGISFEYYNIQIIESDAWANANCDNMNGVGEINTIIEELYNGKPVVAFVDRISVKGGGKYASGMTNFMEQGFVVGYGAKWETVAHEFGHVFSLTHFQGLYNSSNLMVSYPGPDGHIDNPFLSNSQVGLARARVDIRGWVR